MRIIIGETTYTKIKNLMFAPEVDITCAEVRSNQFSADIITSDVIGLGSNVELYYDQDCWADYYIYTADRIGDNVVHIVARDVIWLLDNRTMSQSMYFDEPIPTVVARIFKDITDIYGSVYDLDSDFDNATITGYFPQGSARKRLQKLCFAIGAYVNTSFNGKAQIIKLDKTSPKSIPLNKIFYKPELQYSDYVSAIRFKYYDYSSIVTKDDNITWVEVNGRYYQEQSTEIVVSNPDAPSDVTNEIFVDDIKVINDSNVGAVISRMAEQYFNRISLNASLLNNEEYVPGDYCEDVPTGVTGIEINGYIASADYKFGRGIRSDVIIKNLSIQPARVSILYIALYEMTILTLKSITMDLPLRSHVELENPFIKTSTPNAVWFVIDDTKEFDVVTASSQTVTVTGTLASELTSDGILKIYQVDEAVFEDGILKLYGGGAYAG